MKRKGKEFIGDQQELFLVEEEPGEDSPYERLLGDAMAGDGALFSRENSIEAAWEVVEPVLKEHHQGWSAAAAIIGHHAVNGKSVFRINDEES